MVLMKKTLLLLMLLPLAFAAPWQGTAALAVAASAGLLAVLYMAGMGFGISEFQMMAKEEFFQLIALGVMLAALVGTNSLIDGISTSPALTDCTRAGGCATLQDAAGYSLATSLGTLSATFASIAEFDMDVSVATSKASQCSIMGVGYSISSCGGYSLLATPLSMAGGIAGFAMGELYAMKRLVGVSAQYALSLLLPLGIILRTFRLTRGAGGLLIALAISLHIVLPAGVVFNDMLAATFMGTGLPAAQLSLTAPYKGSPSSMDIDCDAQAIGSGEKGAVDSYNGLRGDLRKYLYVMLVLATLGPVISLLMFAASLRALTSLAGAEVDVSALARFV